RDRHAPGKEDQLQNGSHFQIYDVMLAPRAIHGSTRNSGPFCPVTALIRLSIRPHCVTSIKWIDVKTIMAGSAQGIWKTASSRRTHQLRFIKNPDTRKARNIITFTPIATNISVFMAVVRYFGSRNSSAYSVGSLPIHSPYKTG